MGSFGPTLLALIVGQLGLHACMAGVRLAAPLLALGAGHHPGAVGVLMALFAAAPIALALAAGRLADRHGYHRPVLIGVALTTGGALAAVLATALPQTPAFAVLCVAAALAGAGANVGLIAIQRTAGRLAHDAAQRRQVFSWLGLAPALANALGPVLAGFVIDAGGFRRAFLALALLPLPTLWLARRVPRERAAAIGLAPGPRRSAFGLLRDADMRRLLLVNWLVAASWDLHGFLLPLLGHQRGLSASTIGSILGAFAASVAAVRIVLPLLAQRAREAQVLAAAMLWTGLVFAVYPLFADALALAACAVALGMSLGCVQPMIMSTLHHITPEERHGEAIALRSMTINLSSTLMPLAFGAVGAAVGVSWLFWAMAATVAAGSVPARRVGLRT